GLIGGLPTRRSLPTCPAICPTWPRYHAWERMVEQHLVILLVKLAVAASLASILTRSGRFQRMLMREERTLWQRVQMALVCSLIFGAGVATRVVTQLTHDDYQAVDLGME